MISKTATGEKVFLVSGDFNKSKEYVDYTISLILENDIELKCFRRYSLFRTFNQCLVNKYPYYAIPKLPKKEVINFLLNTAERERKLNFYINYLCKHYDLKDTPEFSHFIREFNFVSN